MTLEEAFQPHLINLPGFLDVPILLKPADYAQDVADAITFPGHQNPRHRRCKGIGYVSEDFKESEFDALPDHVGLQVDWAYDLLQKVKPEVRKLIEGITELHSADWRISRVPSEDKRRGVFQFVVFMYINIGEAYTVRDKPSDEEPQPERSTEQRQTDEELVQQIARNRFLDTL